jgi:hypothetical protein
MSLWDCKKSDNMRNNSIRAPSYGAGAITDLRHIDYRQLTAYAHRLRARYRARLLRRLLRAVTRETRSTIDDLSGSVRASGLYLWRHPHR